MEFTETSGFFTDLYPTFNTAGYPPLIWDGDRAEDALYIYEVGEYAVGADDSQPFYRITKKGATEPGDREKCGSIDHAVQKCEQFHFDIEDLPKG